MNKLPNKYRHLSVWILAAVLVNLLFPSVMEAAQLFCKNTSSVHSMDIHTTSSCWMDIGSDATKIDISNDDCSLYQICEQAIKTGFSETPVIQHQNIQVLGIPFTGLKLSTFLKPAGKITSDLYQNIPLQVLEIYLINSALLN